jgi:metal-responsive CopG/Arc/MetJ family transcriptional regulator
LALDSDVMAPYIRRMSYNATLIVKLPEELKDAVREAARKDYMSDSEWTRRALIEKLERNGRDR